MTEPATATTDPREEPCSNCGDSTVGNYCPSCGQPKRERRQTLGRILKDAIDDQLSVNSAMSRTISTLMLRPGAITLEYLRGRIASYIPPFRLYLITSFLMFLVIQFFGDGGGAMVAMGDANVRTDSASTAQVDSIRRVRIAAGDTAETNLPLGDGTLEARARAKIQRVKKLDQAELNRMFQREFFRHLPFVIFLLVPVFAALLSLLYWRHPTFYVEHFIFALHVHAFSFVLLSLMIMTTKWISMVLAVWVAIYLFLALRRVYRQSTTKSLIKLGVLGIGYLAMLIPALLLTIAIALMLLPV